MIANGEYWDYRNPDPAVIDLDVLTAGMSIVRFRGQTTRPITLAEHSLRADAWATEIWRRNADLSSSHHARTNTLGRAALVGRPPLPLVSLRLHALLHDAHEPLLPWGDCPTPCKTDEMRVAEERIDAVIRQALGLSEPSDDVVRLVKIADSCALYEEAIRWLPGSDDWVRWPLPFDARTMLFGGAWPQIPAVPCQAWRSAVEDAICEATGKSPRGQSMPALTGRQQVLLRFVVEYQRAHGYPPTLREIGDHMGIRSTNGVNDHLKALERKGYVERSGLKSRALRVLVR
jgi:hypothetical protein